MGDSPQTVGCIKTFECFQRKTDCQTNGKTGRWQADRQIGRLAGSRIVNQTGRRTDGQAAGQTGKQAYIYIEAHTHTLTNTDRQTDIHTHTHTPKHTHKHTYTHTRARARAHTQHTHTHTHTHICNVYSLSIYGETLYTRWQGDAARCPAILAEHTHTYNQNNTTVLMTSNHRKAGSQRNM